MLERSGLVDAPLDLIWFFSFSELLSFVCTFFSFFFISFGGAWSCLVFVRNDQKINLQTQGVPANGDWACSRVRGNRRRPEVSDYLITSPTPPVPALFTLCNHLFLNRAGTESVKLDYHRVLVLEQQCLKNQVIQKNQAIEEKKHMILFSLSRSTIVHSRLY